MLYNVFIKNSKLKFGGNQLPAPMKPFSNFAQKNKTHVI